MEERHAGALAAALELGGVPVSLHDSSRRVVYQNALHRQAFGDVLGWTCHEFLRGREGTCPNCPPVEGELRERISVPGFGPARVRVVTLPGSEFFFVEVAPEVPAEEGVLEAFQRLCGVAGTALYLEDLDGRVLDLNSFAVALMGRRREELLGRPIWDFLPQESRELLPQVFAQLEDQGAFRVKAPQRRPDGSGYLAEVLGVRVDGASGPRVIVAVRDLSEEGRPGESRERTNPETDAFLYSVAHDLKAPLLNLKGYAGLLSRELEHGPLRAREFAHRLNRQAGRLESLLADFLDYARVGCAEAVAFDVDVAACARAAWRDLQTQVEEAGAELRIEDGLEPVRMAPLQLSQVLANLFSNALKYRREGTRPAIRLACVRTEPEGGAARFQVCLVVEDNGVGVPEEERAVIFDLFRQGSRRREGSGVGLAIVRRIVEGTGGRVWVESSPDEGSRFYLTLPATGGGGSP